MSEGEGKPEKELLHPWGGSEPVRIDAINHRVGPPEFTPEEQHEIVRQLRVFNAKARLIKWGYATTLLLALALGLLGRTWHFDIRPLHLVAGAGCVILIKIAHNLWSLVPDWAELDNRASVADCFHPGEFMYGLLIAGAVGCLCTPLIFLLCGKLALALIFNLICLVLALPLVMRAII